MLCFKRWVFPAIFLLASTPAIAADVPKDGDTADVLRVYIFNQRPVVMLKVGENFPVPAVFDTGTTGNIMDTKFATFLGLPKLDKADSVDGNSGNHVEGYNSVIDAASIDQVKLTHTETAVLPYSALTEVGILGPNIFSGRLVYLEFNRSEVVLRPKTSQTIPDGNAYAYIDDGDPLPAANVQLPGMKIRAYLDSGNDSQLILPLAMAKKLPLMAPPVMTGHAHGVGDDQDVYSATLRGAVRIGPYTL